MGAHLVGGLDQLLGLCAAGQVGFLHLEQQCSHCNGQEEEKAGIRMDSSQVPHLISGHAIKLQLRIEAKGKDIKIGATRLHGEPCAYERAMDAPTLEKWMRPHSEPRDEG